MHIEQKNKIPLLYTILAAADLLITFFNMARNIFEGDFTASYFFNYLGSKILYLIPVAAFIFISKKAAEIEDMQKRMEIKKFVTVYLLASIVFGVINFFLKFEHIYIPKSISCLFYFSTWLFSLVHLIQYQAYELIFSLLLDVSFLVISLMFAKELTRNSSDEEIPDEKSGTNSVGFVLGIASIVVLSIQTVLNILITVSMHEKLSNTSGEHAIGAAFLVLLVVVPFKLLLSLIFLPAIPLSIVGLVKCNSKIEIEQNRKNRLLGKKINIVCLVIAILELAFMW